MQIQLHCRLWHFSFKRENYYANSVVIEKVNFVSRVKLPTLELYDALEGNLQDSNLHSVRSQYKGWAMELSNKNFSRTDFKIILWNFLYYLYLFKLYECIYIFYYIRCIGFKVIWFSMKYLSLFHLKLEISKSKYIEKMNDWFFRYL